jgi:trimethylamine--corrinoid protein Co-methyltransferase
MLSVIMAKFSGGNLIHDVGYMESGLTGSFEMIVLTDELIAMSDHLMKGIEVNDDMLLLDEIHQVGPGGHFMDTEATLSRFRDFWYPSLLDRNRRETWLRAGGTTLEQRLNQRVKKILAEHRPPALATNVKDKIDGILEQAG